MCLVLYLCMSSVFAQENNNKEKGDSIVTAIYAEETANSKDILTDLFRASIDNLLGNDRTYTFNSSFLGIYQLLHKRRKLPYDRERRLRQNSFNFELKGNDQSDITKIGGGFTITVLNERNITDGDRNKEVDKLNYNVKMYGTLNRAITLYVEDHDAELAKSEAEMNKVMNTWNEASRKHDFSLLHPKIKEALKSLNFTEGFLKENHTYNSQELNDVIQFVLEGKDNLDNQFQRVSKIYAQKPLWVISPTVLYDRINKQGEITISSALTFGLWKKSAQKPWEFEIKGQFKIANDSTLKWSNYNDKPLSMSIGLNKVLLQNKEKESRMEFKFFTQYNHQLGSAPSLQKEDIFTMNATLRVFVYKTLWLPITLKYDVDKGKILGLFTLTANLSK